MRKTLISLSLFGLGLAVVYASSSEFWRDKGYTQWTSDEVDKMLSDSPWAQSAKATAQQQQGMNRGMGRRGGMGGGGMGIPGMGGGGMGRGGGSYPSGGSSIPDVTATIRWQSALPVREALLRQQFGVTKPDDAQVAASLTAPVNNYIIAVLGLPETPPSSRGGGGYGRGTDTDRDDDTYGRSGSSSNSRDDTTDHSLDQVKSASYLSRKDRATLFAEKVQRDKDGVTLLFTFPKTTPITLDDKEVEFNTRYGPLQVKRKFKLKEMVYQSKLEL